MVRRFLESVQGAARTGTAAVGRRAGNAAVPRDGRKAFRKGGISKGFTKVGGHEDFEVTFRMEWDSWWKEATGEFFIVGFYKQSG